MIAALPAAAFGTNCWVLAPGAGQECVVVDPGVGIVPGLDELLARHRLRPAAVLLTHGHVDHVFSVVPVCQARGVPAYLHPDDGFLLADPLAAVGPGAREAFAAAGLEWAEPDDVRPLPDGAQLELAGLTLRVDAAPGHTPGSVLFMTDDGGRPTCLSGDVLFAGSIGRTDLARGSARDMRHSLRTKVLPLPDETRVLPGHGPETTIGAERASNPFLLDLSEVR
nr:MBL fold metallo-hydrolase [Motilibacter aurantiacus]